MFSCIYPAASLVFNDFSYVKILVFFQSDSCVRVNRIEGDILMDAPTPKSWHELLKYAEDKEYWRTRVREMQQPRVCVETGPHIEKEAWAPFTISS